MKTIIKRVKQHLENVISINNSIWRGRFYSALFLMKYIYSYFKFLIFFISEYSVLGCYFMENIHGFLHLVSTR
ncbi:hypothetical protein FE394_11715 [Xenorhabdus sp. Reich]|uniref:Uncharacterized protein n=1 Tax=Xenorhabdus littoralis TaxID=2582835 RepID=A0ABU4SMT6_9GAMM|nr:hypothetical protein [Xenorhabdus sp. Reich]